MPYYTSLDNVRFKRVVRPGDVVELTCRLTRARGPFRFATGEARVAGELCCKAEMSFALMPTAVPAVSGASADVASVSLWSAASSAAGSEEA